MSGFYGDFRPGQSVRIGFNSFGSAPESLSAGVVTIAKDGADVAPTGGVSLSVDVGSTGRNEVVVDTSIDATAFSAGHDYEVRLSAGTAGGVAVAGTILGQFSILNRAVVVDPSGRGTLAPAGLDAVKGWGTWSARQTIQALAAFLVGKRSGVPAAGTGGPITYQDNASVAYGSVTVDTAGNITASGLTPPA